MTAIRTGVRALTLAALVTIGAACSGGSGTASSSSSTPGSPQPQGVIAIGHSGLTGAATDPRDITFDVPANSWATGENPGVDSIYTRLVGVEPAFRGHVANTAVDGSRADRLDAEATAALATVPHPRLAIVEDVGNDIGCDGQDASRYRPFGLAVQRVMARIAAASPSVVILAVPWPGRPLQKARALLESPEATSAGESAGPCELLTHDGRLDGAGIRRLTVIVDGFDAALQRSCAAVKQCVYAAAARGYVDHARLLARDWNHLNPAGHARLAALIWPTVQRALRLG